MSKRLSKTLRSARKVGEANRRREPKAISNRGGLIGGPASKLASPLAIEQTPPRTDVKFPILGFLMEANATGYDLKRKFQDPVGFFYRTSDGSIYPALKKLARDRLVTMRTERQGRRARKVYAITASGRALFERMLRAPAQPLYVFDESQVKIYFAERAPQIALEHMERARRDDAERAELLGRVVEQMRRAGQSTVRRTVVELGRAITEAKAKVLAKLCAQLKREIKGKEIRNPLRVSDFPSGRGRSEKDAGFAL